MNAILASKGIWSLELEDRLGKLALLILFGWSMTKSLALVPGLYAAREFSFDFILMAVTRCTALAFLGLIVWLTVVRKPAVDVARGVQARLAAFMGTFILMVLPLIPAAEISRGQFYLAAMLVLSGTVLSVWCLWWLGTAFSVMASARHLVIAGPYARVRHPLYATEAIFIIGLVLMNGSLGAYFVGAVQFYFQFRRMQHEELVLAKAFPEYADYQRQVPMILPRLA